MSDGITDSEHHPCYRGHTWILMADGTMYCGMCGEKKDDKDR